MLSHALMQLTIRNLSQNDPNGTQALKDGEAGNR